MSTTLAEWFATPLGHYLLAREQAWFDRTIADIFGFHAIQIGLPEYSFLAQSRIAARWTVDVGPPAQVLADPHWLPFPENSLDLVVLPHALEFSTDPHQLLREVHRTVRADGQLVIAGFNPFSLFGARRYFGRGETPPWDGSFIALYRLKDWLALLGFEVTGGGLDGYVPPFAKEKWLSRFRFFESAGDRWWPIAGGVYLSPRDETRARHARDHPGVGKAQERARDRAAPGARVHRADRVKESGTATVTIYTDGACKGNPGPGGWGALLVFGDRERELFGGEPRDHQQPDGNDRRHPCAREPEARVRRRSLHRLAVREATGSRAGSTAGRRTAGRRATASPSRTRTCGASSMRSLRGTTSAGIGSRGTRKIPATCVPTRSPIAEWRRNPARSADTAAAQPTYFTVAAPTLQATSSCDPVPPEHPMAPTTLPFSSSGIPPREAMTPSSVMR